MIAPSTPISFRRCTCSTVEMPPDAITAIADGRPAACSTTSWMAGKFGPPSIPSLEMSV